MKREGLCFLIWKNNFFFRSSFIIGIGQSPVTGTSLPDFSVINLLTHLFKYLTYDGKEKI
ncbi:hypothetical protein ED312_01455 [Sinomicrobium pectinilyticum]|uniref:Uncharacterized protein n=1 Tax=Sinomicrobium pectinilyticum TaxID=1084421 RepID=A0A3N0F2X7_SINP1|nr:hypothetical protein ED312_01455 [Sinomicrobium pectinilyticum]